MMRGNRILATSYQLQATGSRGATLLDVVVGSALMIIVFTGIVGAFQLSVDAISNNKARAGAIALANERLEYIRSLSYDAVGTVGGIPSGDLEQVATTTLNGVTYTRRTLVAWEDDPEDGLGAADANDIVVDYKAVKTSVSWDSRQGTRTITMVTRLSPPNGIETDIPGGTLVIHVVDAEFQPIQNATVQIANTTVDPDVDLTMYSDETGTVTVLGAPPGAGYEVVATKAGYSRAQTYGVTATNTNPIPAHLGVAAYQTTAATFEIDTLSSLRIETYEEITEESWTDTFADSANVTATGVDVGGGVAQLSLGEGGYLESGTVIGNAPAVPYLYRWNEISWNDSQPAGTDIVYRVYDSGGQPLSNGELSGNVAGFTSSPINISGVSTTTHGQLKIGATLSTSDPAATPSIMDWTILYDVGPTPLPNLDFNLHGAKTVGIDAGGSLIYKYDVDHTSDASGSVDLTGIEWDLYTMTVAPADGYDIASSCPPQSVGVVPGTSGTVQLFLTPHTAHSLLVDVRTSDGTPLSGASVRLYRTGYDTTLQTDLCGHEIFPSLSSGTVGGGDPYSIEVSAPGYTTYTSSEVNVSGTTRLSVILN